MNTEAALGQAKSLPVLTKAKTGAKVQVPFPLELLILSADPYFSKTQVLSSSYTLTFKEVTPAALAVKAAAIAS